MATRDAKRGGTAPLSKVLQAYLRESGLDGRLRRGAILKAWGRALGPALRRRAPAVGFRDGELLVDVRSAAHLHELKNFTGEGYRQAANRKLGSERIQRVTYRLRH